MTQAIPDIQAVTDALEAAAPPQLQESYDNTGLQVGDPSQPCQGVMVCVDPVPEVVDEAVAAGCNLIVSHHPLLFRGLKQISGRTPVEAAVIKALRAGVAVYSLHTALDSAPGGVSHEMARMLGLSDVRVLEPKATAGAGLGVTGTFANPPSGLELVERVKRVFGSPVVRCAGNLDRPVRTLALCGGSGSSLAQQALEAGADAYLTSDTGYHTFIDYAPRMAILDIGHYESEHCATALIARIIESALPGLRVAVSSQPNPVSYL